MLEADTGSSAALVFSHDLSAGETALMLGCATVMMMTRLGGDSGSSGVPVTKVKTCVRDVDLQEQVSTSWNCMKGNGNKDEEGTGEKVDWAQKDREG